MAPRDVADIATVTGHKAEVELSYHSPTSVDQAVELLASRDDARPMSGGTDLLVQMRSGRIRPGAIVDIKGIGRAVGSRAQDGGFVIGAATPCTELLNDAALCKAWPGVVEAANLIGSVQVRNRATIGGNLCNASPAADSVPALIAAGARAVVAGPQGERVVAVEDLLAGPGRTTLAKGEFVLEFILPARKSGSADAYLRSIPRTEMDIAVVGAGVNLGCDASGTITAARVALGAVAPTALLVPDAGAALIGSKLDEAALTAMGEAAKAACRPIDDKRGTIDYRIAMSAVYARRAAVIAYNRSRETL
jgi:CO/xanthine dehydrogenase FAD-binding subunit